jgi:hypothetical protein
LALPRARQGAQKGVVAYGQRKVPLQPEEWVASADRIARFFPRLELETVGGELLTERVEPRRWRMAE